MMINQYDIYTLKLNEFSHVSINSIKESIDIYYIRIFLLYSLRDIAQFIKDIKKYPQDRFLFELLEISIDMKNELIYIYESYYTYNNKSTTPEIEALLEEENFIQLCKMGFLDYVVMSKKNFIHLLLAWDKIVDQLPPFALLYLDDQDWYDVLSFDSQEAIDTFVVDHTNIEKLSQ